MRAIAGVHVMKSDFFSSASSCSCMPDSDLVRAVQEVYASFLGLHAGGGMPEATEQPSEGRPRSRQRSRGCWLAKLQVEDHQLHQPCASFTAVPGRAYLNFALAVCELAVNCERMLLAAKDVTR